MIEVGEWVIPVLLAGGSGLIWLGIWLGKMSNSVRSAHHRITYVEDTLKDQLSGLRKDLRIIIGLKEGV